MSHHASLRTTVLSSSYLPGPYLLSRRSRFGRAAPSALQHYSIAQVLLLSAGRCPCWIRSQDRNNLDRYRVREPSTPGRATLADLCRTRRYSQGVLRVCFLEECSYPTKKHFSTPVLAVLSLPRKRSASAGILGRSYGHFGRMFQASLCHYVRSWPRQCLSHRMHEIEAGVASPGRVITSGWKRPNPKLASGEAWKS